MKSFFLIGNPNTGKSTIFNTLTGLHQKIGNYPGVTVEKKEGFVTVAGERIRLIDLPGTYSLTPSSPDEEIVVNLLMSGVFNGESVSGVVVIADATNLERNLYLTTQVMDLGYPTILVVNMVDEARTKGMDINVTQLSTVLGIPVVATVGHKKKGMRELEALLAQPLAIPSSVMRKLPLPEIVQPSLEQLSSLLASTPKRRGGISEALRLLSRDDDLLDYTGECRAALLETRNTVHRACEGAKIDWRALEAGVRYQWIEGILPSVITTTSIGTKLRWQDRLDIATTHRITGPLIFFGLMAIIFQGLFSWAAWPMDMIGKGVEVVGGWLSWALPPGPLQSLVVDGALAGIGAVITFVPQIAFLFFFLSLMEDTGYLSRAAFVMDRLMTKFGLHGKAFIPLLSSFACAIPGIMATRTIESRRDRLITIMIAPLMSCSARLPVYTLLIAACIPALPIFGFFNLQGMVMWGLYMAGVIAALLVALVLKKTLLRTTSLPLLMEMPPYRVPQMSTIFKKTWERSRVFVTNAGTVIFALSIVLWFLTSYPKTAGVEQTFAGYAGRFIEPLIAPLGFDWKIGIALIASFAAREVFVSTMAIIYQIANINETSTSLIEAIRTDVDRDGNLVFTPLVAISLLIFYVLACQCLSTVAVVKRETNSWRWPIFMVAYMTVLAYVASLIVFQGGRWLGW